MHKGREYRRFVMSEGCSKYHYTHTRMLTTQRKCDLILACHCPQMYSQRCIDFLPIATSLSHTMPRHKNQKGKPTVARPLSSHKPKHRERLNDNQKSTKAGGSSASDARATSRPQGKFATPKYPHKAQDKLPHPFPDRLPDRRRTGHDRPTHRSSQNRKPRNNPRGIDHTAYDADEDQIMEDFPVEVRSKSDHRLRVPRPSYKQSREDRASLGSIIQKSSSQDTHDQRFSTEPLSHQRCVVQAIQAALAADRLTLLPAHSRSELIRRVLVQPDHAPVPLYDFSVPRDAVVSTAAHLASSTPEVGEMFFGENTFFAASVHDVHAFNEGVVDECRSLVQDVMINENSFRTETFGPAQALHISDALSRLEGLIYLKFWLPWDVEVIWFANDVATILQKCGKIRRFEILRPKLLVADDYFGQCDAVRRVTSGDEWFLECTADFLRARWDIMDLSEG